MSRVSTLDNSKNQETMMVASSTKRAVFEGARFFHCCQMLLDEFTSSCTISGVSSTSFSGFSQISIQ